MDVSGVEKLLLSTHYMLAAMTKTPELMLAEEEAKALAVATNAVSRHYDVAVAAKTMDWINLAIALGTVYGPRMVAISSRSKREKPQRPEAPRRAAPSEPAPDTNADIRDIPGVGRVNVTTGERVN